MAIKIDVVYPGGTDPGTVDYPDGVPRDVSAPSAGDGTPWAVAIVKDWSGFFQGLLARSGIVASGNPDTVLISDYADSMDMLYGQPLLSQWDGLTTVYDSGSLFTTAAGKIRNQANTRWLTHAASLQKNALVPWVAGPAVGALADTVVLAQGYLRRFLVNKADFSGSDIVLDTDIAAGNFFGSAAATAAGYTDATLYRRISYMPIGSGLTLTKMFHKAYDPTRHRYDEVSNIAGSVTAATGSRTAGVVDCPPGMIWRGAIRTDVGGTFIGLITTLDQTDSVPVTANNHNIGSELGGTRDYQNGEYEADASSQLYARSFSTVGSVNFHTEGWIDNLLVP